MNKVFLRIVIISFFIFFHIEMEAQDTGAYGSYSPYTMFGIGDLSKQGTSFNKSMGGVGIATRNRRYVNYLNPASLTARDSLSFMADFGISQNNKIYRQGDMISGNNTFNIYNFVISFPIYRSSAFMIGITPYSDVGYDFSSVETDQDIIGSTGNITHNYYGEGGIYQFFFGGGVTFWKKLSLGAEFIYYFGNIDKVYNVNYSNSSIRSINSGHNIMINSITGKFGLQFQQRLSDRVSMTLGATYKLASGMKGEKTFYEYANQSSVTDTSAYVVTPNNGNVKFADEMGFGISLTNEGKWAAEVNYLRSDWTSTGIDDEEGFSSLKYSKFSAAASNSIRAGFEFIPNRNDIRYYFKRCAYRAGVYYDQAYYKFDGNRVNSLGMTLGISLPVVRGGNAISLGIDFGQRGSMRNNMVRERYVNFLVGFNIYDIWFRKTRYE